MKGTKLHELTVERLAELVHIEASKVLEVSAPPPPDIRTQAPDPNNPTREQALHALKAVYRQMLSGKPIFNQKIVASRMIAPAILYLESLSTKGEEQ